MVSPEMFLAALQRHFAIATERGWEFIEVQALQLHQEVLKKTSEGSMALCCKVMHDAMIGADRVTATTKQGKGAMVEIRYYFPRDGSKDDYLPSQTDTRSRELRPVALRPGQGDFKESLIDRYGNECAVTGSKIFHILEACAYLPLAWRERQSPEERTAASCRHSHALR